MEHDKNKRGTADDEDVRPSKRIRHASGEILSSDCGAFVILLGCDAMLPLTTHILIQ